MKSVLLYFRFSAAFLSFCSAVFAGQNLEATCQKLSGLSQTAASSYCLKESTELAEASKTCYKIASDHSAGQTALAQNTAAVENSAKTVGSGSVNQGASQVEASSSIAMQAANYFGSCAASSKQLSSSLKQTASGMQTCMIASSLAPQVQSASSEVDAQGEECQRLNASSLETAKSLSNGGKDVGNTSQGMDPGSLAGASPNSNPGGNPPPSTNTPDTYRPENIDTPENTTRPNGADDHTVTNPGGENQKNDSNALSEITKESSNLSLDEKPAMSTEKLNTNAQASSGAEKNQVTNAATGPSGTSPNSTVRSFAAPRNPAAQSKLYGSDAQGFDTSTPKVSFDSQSSCASDPSTARCRQICSAILEIENKPNWCPKP